MTAVWSRCHSTHTFCTRPDHDLQELSIMFFFWFFQGIDTRTIWFSGFHWGWSDSTEFWKKIFARKPGDQGCLKGWASPLQILYDQHLMALAYLLTICNTLYAL
ncbi:GH22332 [Drosophila grimshawi]|uniref:GH22332 n=1 Tax=Drosophila grimshawi TaxID=7222 RepID=B4JYV5_DROGR|nr:GH22332 [Drosophila grimshawi]